MTVGVRSLDYHWALEFNEALHPREHGRFISTDTPHDPTGRTPKSRIPEGEKVHAKDVHPRRVAAAVNSGQVVKMTGPALRAAAVKWGTRGEGAVALHNVEVTGKGNENLFTQHATELPREAMPVLRDNKDVADFGEKLNGLGIGTKEEDVDPRSLTATQNQVDGAKAGHIMEHFEEKDHVDHTTLVVDRDGHILDGHHRWAAASLYGLGHPGATVHVLRANTDIQTLLNLGEDFDEEKGIEHKRFGATASDAFPAHGGEYSPWPTPPDDAPPVPDPKQPWAWCNKGYDGKPGWRLLATDDGDDVPRHLTFPTTDALTAASYGARVVQWSPADYLAALDKPRPKVDFSFDEDEHPRGPGGRFEPTGNEPDRPGRRVGTHVRGGSVRVGHAPQGSRESYRQMGTYLSNGDGDTIKSEVEDNRRDFIDTFGKDGQAVVDSVKSWSGPFDTDHDAEPDAMLRAAEAGPRTTVPLYRGMFVPPESMDEFASLQPGDVIPNQGGAAFTSDKDWASGFMGRSGPPDFTTQGVIIHMEPGAQALNITSISNGPEEHEFVSASDMEVVRVVTTSPHQIDVHVRAAK